MNVGSLIAYLDLDDTNFDRKTKAANKQIDGLALNLEALGKLNPELKFKTDRVTADVKAVKAQLDSLKAKAAEGTDVRVETTQAMLRLAALKAEMRGLHAEAAKSLKVNYDDSGLRKLSADLDGVSQKLKGVGTGGLFGSALAFGPALAPFGGAAVGMLGGITSAATEAVSAVGVLALALKGVSGASTSYQAYQAATASANNSYAQALAAAANKSGKARTSAVASANASRSKALGTAQFNLNQSAYGKSSAATQQFVKFDQTQLHPFGAGVMSSAQAGVLPGLTSGLASLVKDAPQIDGAINKIGTSVGNLMAEAGHALNSPFWKQWITWFGKDSAKNVGTMGHSVGQLVEALARMDQRSGGAGKIVADLDRLSTRLNNWSASPAFLTFLDHIRTDEAQASKFLHALWTDLDPILKGLSATGGAEMQLLTGALDVISHLPTGWLEAAGRWLPIIFLSMKLANGPVAGIASGLSGATKAMAGFVEATAGGSALDKLKLGAEALGPAFKAVAGTAGIGLLIDSTSHAVSGFNALETAAGGALAGFAVGGPVGAGIGAVTGLFLEATRASGLFSKSLDMSVPSVKDIQQQYQDLSNTLDGVTLAYTKATAAQILADSKKPGKNGQPSQYADLHSLGLTDRQIVSIGEGAPDSATKKQLAALQKKLRADLTNLQGQTPTDAVGIGMRQGQMDVDNRALNTIAGLPGVGHAAQVKQAHDNAVNAVLDLSQITKALGNASAAQAVYNSDTGNTSKGMADLLQKFGGLKKFNGTQIKALIALEGGPSALLSYQGVIAQMRVDAAKGVNTTLNLSTAAAFAQVQQLQQTLGVPGFMGPIQTPKAGPAPHKHALGTNWASAGFAMVGEQGRELVKLNTGDRVYPHPRTEAMMRQTYAQSGPQRLHPDDLRTLAALMARHASGAAHEVLANELNYQYGG